jgi:hypothetical protein
VEGGQDLGEPADLLVDRLTGMDQGRQAPGGRHPPHHHEVVTEHAVGSRHVGDAEVHVRRQPAVEVDLVAAHRKPPLAGAEVEESQVHRLLELVGTVADEEDDRRVGLVHRHEAAGARRAGRVASGRHAPTVIPLPYEA